MATGFFTFQLNSVHAQPCNDLGGWVVSVEGAFTVAGNLTQMGEAICSGDEISVGQDSRGAIRLASSQTVVRVNQNSSFVIEPSGTDGTLLKLFKGVLYLFSRRPQSFSVDTPYINAAIDGTEFVIETSAESSEITVIEGSVNVSNAQGSVRVTPGEVANAGPNQAPQRRTVIDPVDAVQWALYYPPIGAAENTSAAIRSAAEMLARGDVEKAEALLAASPEDAASLALKAIIAVTRNQSAEALQLAQRAVSTDPDSSLAYSALSYAQQAAFDIDQALASASLAVRNDPENADALARQAELQLGVDETADALMSAREAVLVDSTNSRARTILGFVHLVRLDVGKAQEAFSDAVDLDPGYPLPRLGLGLAVIRDGRLVEGREQIEVAASLDPANALVRSYLGKAYFEERKTGDASAQFELAKGLDPQDPTVWFYDALLDQALNRPVSAYEKINRARELNDNQLVYQSRLLVDKDEAAGLVSLASIYIALGFEDLAITESTRSIARNPINFSAYRLLADSYAGRERHEAARRNVLFQAALLQPLTSDPVQQYEQESDLLTLPGTDPTDPSIREYSPMFEREGFQLAGSLIAGDNSTFGDNLVLSGLRDQIAYGLAHSHYGTDGASQNADIEHNVYHGFIQGQISPTLQLQADLQRRETEQGDFALNFNTENSESDRRVSQETTTPRLGLRADLNPRGTLLLAARAIDRSEHTLEPQEIINLRNSSDVEGIEAFARYIHRGDRFQQTFGVDAHELDQRSRTIFEVDPCPIESCVVDTGTLGSSFANYYYYADFATRYRLLWTLGLTYSMLDDEEALLDRQDFYPKLGIRWQPTGSHEFRLMASRGVKRSIVADLMLEPTMIAGFNQIRDDFGGTRFTDTGIAYDVRFGSTNLVGMELFHRELKIPVLGSLVEQEENYSFNESQRETTFRGYWNLIINRNTSFGLGLLLEHSEREGSTNASGEQTLTLPLRVDTYTVPLRLYYAHPSGFFAQTKFSLVYQEVERASQGADAVATTSVLTTDERFSIIDLSLGMRLPKRKVTFRLDVNNLLDEAIQFQGGNIRSAEPSSSQFSPRRTLVGKVSFLF